MRSLIEDEEQRRLRMSPISDDHRLTNVGNIMPSHIMGKIPYAGEKMVVVYRGVSKGDPVKDIRAGDWVSLTRKYAQLYGGGKVIKKKVLARHVSWAGTDENEWFYSPGRGK
jgi:hypothetical protein